MNFIVTGGIGVSQEEQQIWQSSGAVAVGMGSALGNSISDKAGFKKRVAELKANLK